MCETCLSFTQKSKKEKLNGRRKEGGNEQWIGMNNGRKEGKKEGKKKNGRKELEGKKLNLTLASLRS